MKTSEESERRWLLKLMKFLEVIILLSILVLVWGIFVVLPVVFYALPPLMANTEQGPGQLPSNSSAGCLEQRIYAGTVCSEELQQWQMCFSSQQTNNVYVPSSIDQDGAESMANLLLRGLQFLPASPECVTAIKPFMCLYLFGSCDTNNQLRQVSQSECMRLRDDVCAEPWKKINMVREGALPDCSTFGDQEIQCLDTNGTLFSNHSEDVTLAPNSQTMECDEGFYLHNDSICRHLCSSWVDPPGIDPDTVIIMASLVNAVVSSTIIIIVTLTLLRKEMLRFPKYYLIYLCLTTVVIVLVVLIGVADKKVFFCSSESLVESFVAASSYCTLNGIVYHYGVIQIGLWTLFFTLGFFWGIFFPFHYQKFKSSDRLKYIHATTVLLGICLPIVPVAVQLIKDGYQLSEAPRRAICTGQDITATFFGFLLPFNILSAIITSLLVLIFWKILKELAIKKLLREAKPSVVGRAEAKILCVICYYILTSCLILITFMYSLVSRERSEQIITDYLTCQSTGLQPGKECGETPDVQLGVLNSLGTTSVFFQSFVPVIVLIFISKCTGSWNSKWTNSMRGTSHSRSRSSNNTV